MSTDIRNVNLTLGIPMRYIGNEEKALQEKLNRLVSQYVPELDGILIKWTDLNISGSKGYMQNDQPYVFWKVAISAHVFQPTEGKLVKGRVQKLLKTYFIATAMNCFTVTVAIPDDLIEHEILQTLKLDQDVYFKIKGSSEGTYQGILDEECLNLVKGLVKQEKERSVERDVYEYAKDFEY